MAFPLVAAVGNALICAVARSFRSAISSNTHQRAAPKVAVVVWYFEAQTSKEAVVFEAQPNGVKDSNSVDAVHETVAQLSFSVYLKKKVIFIVCLGPRPGNIRN